MQTPRSIQKYAMVKKQLIRLFSRGSLKETSNKTVLKHDFDQEIDINVTTTLWFLVTNFMLA